MALNPSKWRHKKRIEPKGNVSHRFARRNFSQKGMTRSAPFQMVKKYQKQTYSAFKIKYGKM
jgi:hypothetical protein